MDLSNLHPLEKKFLKLLKKNEVISEEEVILKGILSGEHVRGVIGWLKARGMLRELKVEEQQIAELTEIGKRYLKEGLPSRKVWQYLIADFRDVSQIQNHTVLSQSEAGKALGLFKKNNMLIFKDKKVKIKDELKSDDSDILGLEQILNLADGKNIFLSELTSDQKELLLKNAKKRGSDSIFRLKDHKIVYYKLSDEGENIREYLSTAKDQQEEIGFLTKDMLEDKSWKKKKFRKFNISLSPKPRLSGRLHPYGRFLDSVRSKLTGMGFVEMRGPVVESEFYNSDLLYMPQFHPARDIHDIYIVKEPKKAFDIQRDILERVAAAHRDGGRTGSSGWGYEFDVEKTHQMILRSQGTAISARTLSHKPNIPGKYFAIARCFRYDQVDATHAPDFFQVEGIVIEDKINFRHLLGLLSNFAKNFSGAKNIKFVPSYFPFTEPSVEAHIEHPELGWIELGGAGIFRPEITETVNISCPVIAWGLGLDRMAMNALKINDIRELFTSDLETIRWTKVVI